MHDPSAAAALQLLHWDHGQRGNGQTGKQNYEPYMTIRLVVLLDLSRTPGAVCQSIQRRSAPEVDADIEVWVLRGIAAS